MRTITAVLLSALVVWLTTATMLAHEVVYKGTVVAVEPNRFAALDGALATIQVKLSGDDSENTRPRVFTITYRTQLFRGDRTVPFAAARIQKDERVAVMINNDEPGNDALEIRLAAEK